MSEIPFRLNSIASTVNRRSLESWLDRLRIGRVRSVISRHLSAISMTFFAESPWVGLAGVAVLACFRPKLAVAALLVSVMARLTAQKIRAQRTLLDSGLIELNGWFLGLACATFYAGPSLIVALLFGGALAAVLSIIMHRLLATWDLPLLVAPYVPAFWLISAALFALPWSHAATLTVGVSPSSPVLLVVIGGLRGIGQIFYLPDARVGVGLAVAASIADRRLGPGSLLNCVGRHWATLPDRRRGRCNRDSQGSHLRSLR